MKTYLQKLVEFKELGPFYFLSTLQYHGGDESEKPLCDVCNSRRSYWFMVVTDSSGKIYHLGSECSRHIKIDYGRKEAPQNADK
jgi:hypothetical protein